jgi:CBS domain-containing protein
VNFVIAGVIIGVLVRAGTPPSLAALDDPRAANLWLKIAGGNLILALFNLLPAFPMDGGRILRSLLALRRPEQEATRIAAGAGRFLAVALGLYGLLSMNFMLVFIAFFVYLGAAQEGAVAVGRMYMQGVPVRSAMVTDFRTLSHGDTIRDAANLLLATSQQDFPVVHGEQVVGMLSRTALLKALASEGPEAYVAGAMDRDFVRISPDADLADALPLLGQSKACALVMAGDRLVGLLTSENLAEYILVRRFGLRPGQ